MAFFQEKDALLILDLISRFPEGASLEEIFIGLAPPPARRTLQYRLSALVKAGRLVAKGRARARRYSLPLQEVAFIPDELEEGISLSIAAKAVQEEVSRPIQQRRHVTYNRDFLDQYHPNKTYYIPEFLRKKLAKLGKRDRTHPAGTYARQIFSRLLIDLSWNSSRLEGNTYSLLETERLIQLGEAAAGKDRRETQMILNHKAAIEFIVESAENIRINRYTILNIHALLSDELLEDSASGSLRLIPVGIGGSVYLPLAVPQLISECFQQIVETASAIKDPLEQAFFLMVHLPYLQPFEDVNKRVSRLAANLPLIRENLCPLSFVDVPEQIYINALLGVYELNRVDLLLDVFVWAYKRSCSRYSIARQSLADPDPFRMQYRDLRKETVALVVRKELSQGQATQLIQQQAKDFVPLKDRSRFVEVVEMELRSLHEGNISRYRLRQSEYEKWQRSWSDFA